MTDDTEIAERLTRSRARMIPALVVLFSTQQAAYFANTGENYLSTGPERLRLAAWLIMSLVLLIFLATGGAFFRSAHVRALLNDETTKAHRADAATRGFWVAMIFCFFLYGVSMYEVMDARTAIHIIMTVGIGVALLRFSVLERRALK